MLMKSCVQWISVEMISTSSGPSTQDYYVSRPAPNPLGFWGLHLHWKLEKHFSLFKNCCIIIVDVKLDFHNIQTHFLFIALSNYI